MWPAECHFHVTEFHVHSQSMILNEAGYWRMIIQPCTSASSNFSSKRCYLWPSTLRICYYFLRLLLFWYFHYPFRTLHYCRGSLFEWIDVFIKKYLVFFHRVRVWFPLKCLNTYVYCKYNNILNYKIKCYERIYNFFLCFVIEKCLKSWFIFSFYTIFYFCNFRVTRFQ